MAQLLLILASFGAFLIVWQMIRWLFPALLTPVPTGIAFIDRYGILMAATTMILLHENTHALVAWRFTNRWPTYGITPLGFYINTAEWYFPRWVMIAISIAPFLFLNVLGILLLVILPTAFARLSVWFILLNCVGSMNDVAVATWTFFQPDSALIQNNGREIRIYRAEVEVLPTSKLRDRIRVFLERVWTKQNLL